MTGKEGLPSSSSLRVSVSRHQVTRWILRGSVLVLQVFGSFPYTWSGLPHRPKFSLSLCLWAAFIKIFLVVGMYLNITTGQLNPKTETSEVLSVVAEVYLTFELVGAHLIDLFMLVRSPKLARILNQLPEPLEAKDAISHLNGRVLRFFILETVIAITFGFYYILNQSQSNSIPLQVVLTMVYVIGICELSSVYFIFKIILVIISQRLVNSVKEVLDSPPKTSTEISFQILERNCRQVR